MDKSPLYKLSFNRSLGFCPEAFVRGLLSGRFCPGWFLSVPPFFRILIHSFIHIEHLYSASSRELFRGAPDSSTAKKSSLKVRKKTQVTKLYGKSEVEKGAHSRSKDPPRKKRGSAL